MDMPAYKGLLPADTLPLGFGCEHLTGFMDRAAALRIVQAALDAGVTYFDTARMYGNGAAESVLGELVPSRRDRMILVSKGGILPPSRSIATRVTGKAFNLLHRVPGTARLRSPAFTRPRTDVFDIPTLRQSLEESLRSLRTDHLDFFLLHEVSPADASRGDLVQALLKWQAEGKFKAFGIDGKMEQVESVMSRPNAVDAIIQIPSDPWNRNIDKLAGAPGSLKVTRSSLGARFDALTARLRDDPALKARWSGALGIDAGSTDAVAAVFLAHALARNPDGMVLMAPMQAAQVTGYANSVKQRQVTHEQVTALDGLAAL